MTGSSRVDPQRRESQSGKVTSQKERKRQAEKLTRHAIAKHGELKGRKARPPLNQLILSVFYHLTSVRRATRALRQLKRGFVDWNEIRVSHPVEVSEALSSADWARIGSERVLWLLRELNQVYHCTDLDFLAELTPQQARICLKGLPTVSRHMADEVLLLSLDVPVLPAPAEVVRLCHRFGILADDRPTLENQRILEKLFDPQYYASLHLFFCDYAGKVCLPEEPSCKECALVKDCPSAKQHRAKAGS